jgi:hypothetical protein
LPIIWRRMPQNSAWIAWTSAFAIDVLIDGKTFARTSLSYPEHVVAAQFSNPRTRLPPCSASDESRRSA